MLVVDGQHEFAQDFIAPALKANVLYEGVYPLSAALSRPLICQKLVQVAEAEGAEAVAHGCTGKGNDQVRFDVSIAALQPELKVIAPVREWPMSREEEIDYARQRNITVPVGKKNPFSIDENLGSQYRMRVIEDRGRKLRMRLGNGQIAAGSAGRTALVEINICQGCTGRWMAPYIWFFGKTLNGVGGEHSVGRIGSCARTFVGIKSRELLNVGADDLVKAHQDLKADHAGEVAQFKPLWSRSIGTDLWWAVVSRSNRPWIFFRSDACGGERRGG